MPFRVFSFLAFLVAITSLPVRGAESVSEDYSFWSSLTSNEQVIAVRAAVDS